jgi:hypothetical protein
MLGGGPGAFLLDGIEENLSVVRFPGHVLCFCSPVRRASSSPYLHASYPYRLRLDRC